MGLLSVCNSKNGTLQRQKLVSHQNIPVPLRRSNRLQLKKHSTPIPQSLPKHQPTAPQTSHLHLPTAGLIEEPVSLRLQHQVDLLSTYTSQSQNQRPEKFIEKHSERPLKRACLTERNLRLFTDLGNMRKRSKKEPNQSSRFKTKPLDSKSKSSQASESKSASKTASTTDTSFPRLAFENGILDPVNSTPPKNLNCQRDRLDRERNSESPTESEYNRFSYQVEKATNEMSVLLATSTLLKQYSPGYRPVYSKALAGFPKNVGLNNGLSAAKPDLVEGLDLRQFGPFPAREELGEAAVPILEADPPTLSHLAGEWKGPGKNMIYAQTQAAYDGACLVYGRNKARSYLGDPDPPGHSYVSTFTTDGTILHTYTHYSSSSKGKVEYHQFPTSSSLLKASYGDFKRSQRRLRNLQDEAKGISEQLRDDLNEKWLAGQQHVANEHEDDEPSVHPALTNAADEDGGEFLVQVPTVDAPLSSKRQARYQKGKRSNQFR